VALLAGVGAGLYGSVAQACDATIKVRTTQKPDMALNDRYMKSYGLYGKLYKSLKEDFKEAAGII
jgi:xylulokinase